MLIIFLIWMACPSRLRSKGTQTGHEPTFRPDRVQCQNRPESDCFPNDPNIKNNAIDVFDMDLVWNYAGSSEAMS